MDSKRTYSKVDDFTFKVEQDRHIEEVMPIDKELNYVAQLLNGLRECVAQANQAQDKFVKIVEIYNTHCDILEEAKKECWFDYKVPQKIDIPDCFSIIEVKLENIPKVDIHKEKSA